MRHLIARTLSAIAFISPVGAWAQSVTYEIDPTHTFVTFEVDHFGTSTNRGRFDKKTGSVTLDRTAKKGRLELTIDTASINTGTGPFDGHLKGGAFFNVATYPTATFVADQFTFDGDKVTAVTGTLTMLGKPQPVTLTAKRFNCYTNPMLRRQVCGGDFEATLQRSKWGIDFGLNMGMSDAVKLVIQAEAIAQP